MRSCFLTLPVHLADRRGGAQPPQQDVGELGEHLGRHDGSSAAGEVAQHLVGTCHAVRLLCVYRVHEHVRVEQVGHGFSLFLPFLSSYQRRSRSA